VWQEDESPYELIAQGLKDRGVGSGKIGLEETVRFVFAEGISKSASQATITSATPVTAGCRMLKSPHEVALMRLAAQITLAAYEATYKAIKEGMTQPQVEDLVEKAHEQLGFKGGADVQVGEFSAFPHGSVTPQVIHEGTIVLMDGGCTVEGYASDITRTFVLGKANEKMKSVFNIVHRAQSAALAAARPGVECGAIDAAARKIVTDAGFGPDYKYFTHRLGHGMGMDGHEWPYLVRGNKTKLQANMTTSDEPGIYIRGEFGVRLEDDMHITENGAELFTPQSLSLEDPFAKV
jgi:Xaa-Pro dipeptidase